MLINFKLLKSTFRRISSPAKQTVPLNLRATDTYACNICYNLTALFFVIYSCDNNALPQRLMRDEELSSDYSEVVTQACTYAKYIRYIKFHARFYVYAAAHIQDKTAISVTTQSLCLRCYLA